VAIIASNRNPFLQAVLGYPSADHILSALLSMEFTIRYVIFTYCYFLKDYSLEM